MKLAKSLLLGSAAAIAATASAQAADLPFRKAAPVEYVRVCDWTGAGYFYIPGTDTCLKIGGFIRAEYEYVTGGKVFVPAIGGGTLISSKNRDRTGYFVRGRIDLDARTQTAYGTLRTYVRYQADRASGAEFTNSGIGATTQPQGSSSNTYLDKGFIQFAGITAGRVQSFFDFGADPYGFEGVATTDASSQVFAYTYTAAGGFSATISAEDPNVRRDGIGNTALTLGGTPTTVAYAGDRAPDVVGVLRVDQAWGAAQLSAAYHEVNTTTAAALTSKSESGFAVRGAVLFKLPMLAAGDEFQVEGGYADGAYSYTNSNGFGGGYGSPFLVGGFQHPNVDAIAIATPGGYTLAKERGWSISGGFVHYFTPNFQNIVFGSYEEVDYGKAGSISWINGGIGRANSYRIADQFNWFPVKDLQIGLELMYIKQDQKLAGLAANPLPTGVKLNQDAFVSRLRMERDF